MAEEPKLAPYIPEMRKKLSQALALKENQVNIKAKTNEGLDAVGRKEAISAMAIAGLL